VEVVAWVIMGVMGLVFIGWLVELAAEIWNLRSRR